MNDQAQQVKFYTDTHIAKAVATQLRLRGIDVVRCEEVGMAEAEDEAHLVYASEQSRVVVSQDNDFSRLHALWLEAGKPHGGIMLVPKHLQGEAQISYTVRKLTEYHELITGGAGQYETDVANHLIFL